MRLGSPIKSGLSKISIGLRRIPAHLSVLTLSVLAAIAVAVAVPTSVKAVRDDPNQHWLGAWAASPLPPDPIGTTDAAVLSRTGFDQQTLRQIVFLHAGGAQVRVRLANTFGSQPLTIGQADVALQSNGASTLAGSDRQLTFSSHGTVTIPAGAEAYSDPVALSVDALHTLAISLYFPAPTGPTTWHFQARQTLYQAPGNQTASPDGTAFETLANVPSWYVLDGVDVAAAPGQGAIVTLGDSITDGTNSTQDANNRWPDYLARRLIGRGNQLSVVNAGIGANRVLSDTQTPAPSVNAQARLDRDVLSQDGVQYVIVLEGINDIGQACLGSVENSAEDIIDGYKQMITQVHAKGIKIFGATLTPFMGAQHDTPSAGYYCEAGELKRGVVNSWIRASGEFDGVIDFDQATRDPANPLMFPPSYDSGDHLHPNDAGYETMANAIDLSLFARSLFAR